MFSAEIPAAETSTSLRTRVGNASASSAPMKPPIELPTTTGVSMPSSVAQRVDHPREALDRDLARRHLRRAEPGQVGASTRMRAHERRDVQQPVLPQPAEPVQEQQRRAVAAGVDHVDAAAEDHLRPRQRRPVDRHPGRVVAVGVGRVRAGRAKRRWRERSYLPDEPRHAATVPAAVRLAIDIDSTLHPYWDQLAEIAQRRFGVDLPYDDAVHVGDRPRCGPSSCRPASRRPTAPSTCSPPSPTPARSRRSARWHEAGPLHPHHRATARPTPTPPPSGGCEQIGLPHDELYCSYDKIARCVRDRDRRADRRLAGQPRAGARGGHHRRDARAPVEPRPVRGGGHHCAPDWPTLAQRLEPAAERMSEQRALPGAARDSTTRASLCPRSSPSARSPTGAAPSASRAARQDALRVPLPLLVPGRGRGDRARARPPAARCSSPTTPARCRRTRR